MTARDISGNAATIDEKLTPEQVRARARLKELIEEQGVRPITLEELEAMGDLWPEDEDIDDFLTALREWRTDKSIREQP
jgi:hypothetical protein